MDCPKCQTQNPPEAKFCMNCGSKLVFQCPECGTELPPDASFCFNCGHKLADPAVPPSSLPLISPAPSPPSSSPLEQFIPKELLSKLESARAAQVMEGERRIVTMLFCDTKGSTAAASQLDPEEWAEIINGAFEHMIKPVYKYEGTIARLMGDAILAFFGAPIAHEDDPERAVRAGLEIVQSIQPYNEKVKRNWGLEIDVRVGINTGLVVVGAVGSDLRMEYSALGDAINLAARMEQTADPGTVRIAEPTYKQIAPLFDFENLGGIEVKGKAEPVQAYRVLGVKTERGQLRGIQGLDSPLVGRDAEMHTLRGAIIELRQGRGGIISLMGEAGLGKSRLIAELRKEPTPVTGGKISLHWLEGRSLSYENTTPYAPFIDLLNESFSLQNEQTNDEKYIVIKSQIETLLPEHGNRLAPFIASLLEVTPSGYDNERIRYLEPPRLRGGIFQAVAHYLEYLAQDQPLVLAIDDIHWIDPSSLDLLESLLPLTDRVPVLLITLFRPRRQEPSWRFHETAQRNFAHRYKTIQLQPLDKESSRELVANLLHVEDLPPRVRQLILDKSEGNPFFVEEVIRSLLDAGLVVQVNGHWRTTKEIENISVPDTLAAVINTRLDRLKDDEKQIIQTASVIGREFQYNILNEIYEMDHHHLGGILDSSLTDLQRRELVREKARIPQRLYTFKHALTQETAYESLLHKKRRELHRMVAECLEKNEPDRVAEIARHFIEARELARSLPYLLTAAERAAHAYATPEAIGFYRQSLTLLDRVDNLPLLRRAFEGLGNALTFAQQIPEAVETYQKMYAAANTNTDDSMKVSALNKLALVTSLYMGNFDTANTYLAEADSIARGNEDKFGVSELSLVRCMMCTAAADFEGVVRYMDETVALGKELGVKEQIVMGLEHIANSQLFMTLFEQGWESIQEGLAISREIGDRHHEAGLLLSAFLYHFGQGDLDAAQKAADETVLICEQIGAVQQLIYATWGQGLIAQMRGDYERALERHEYSLKVAKPVEDFIPFAAVHPYGALGMVYLEISPEYGDKAVEYHLHVLDMMDNPMAALGGGTVYADAGLCALQIGKTDLAEKLLQKGLESPSLFQLLETPRYLAGLALIAMERGNLDKAAEKIAEARAYAYERGMKSHYPFIFLNQGKISAARGELETAIEHYTQAESFALEMGMRPYIWQARAGAARALAALGKDEEAIEQRQKAFTVLEEIAGLFENEELWEKFCGNMTSKITST
ncbi:MAG TPA: adenylate/guanylate cyclase domain-containing protein [Anaerolineales bacterium]|nr:adenylate/guanylate cyclase domain-containing protein [Anaerolineales bacterium]